MDVDPEPETASRDREVHASRMGLLGAIAWGLPLLLVHWSRNMLLLAIWPWVLAGLMFFAAHGGNSGPVSRSRTLASMAVCALCFVLAAVHWFHVFVRGAVGGPEVEDWLLWATVVGGVYLCTMYGIAYEKRRRSDLAFADALLIVWLFGPAIPWAGEVP